MPDPLPEVPGEPGPPLPGGARALGLLALRCLGVVLLSAAMAPLLLAYLAVRSRFPRPPNVASAKLHWTVLRWVLADAPPPPGLSGRDRVALGLTLARQWLLVPFWGLAWYLDELLYGHALRKVVLRAPLFEISAARSGSTQLARYLEQLGIDRAALDVRFAAWNRWYQQLGAPRPDAP